MNRKEEMEQRYAELLQWLDEGANYSGYPEGFGRSWPALCAKAASAIRVLQASALRASAAPEEGIDWKDDPSADERWNAGCDFAMTQLCKTLGVEPETVTWDAATETVDGDVRAVIGNIMRVKYGEDWGPAALPSDSGKAAPDVDEDDPDVVVTAHAIAEHGFGRPWDDFLLVNAHDTDQGDLIEYARAAVISSRSRAALAPATEDRWEYENGNLLRDGVSVFHFDPTVEQAKHIAELVTNANALAPATEGGTAAHLRQIKAFASTINERNFLDIALHISRQADDALVISSADRKAGA